MSKGVWVSWPGGIGWPTPLPLSGGKRKTQTRKNRKNTRKNRKASRKNRRSTRRS